MELNSLKTNFIEFASERNIVFDGLITHTDKVEIVDSYKFQNLLLQGYRRNKEQIFIAKTLVERNGYVREIIDEEIRMQKEHL